MKILLASILALASFASYAQNSLWSLTEIPNSNKETVGYIYHVYARGTATYANTNSTVAAGLRFVCSVSVKQDPVIAIFWNGVLMSETVQELEIAVDKTALLKSKWTHEGSLIYSATVDPALLSALKRGRTVKFSWEGNESSKYVVVFDLRNFNLTDFNNSCKTQL